MVLTFLWTSKDHKEPKGLQITSKDPKGPQRTQKGYKKTSKDQQKRTCKRSILKHPVFNVLNFRGWIKLICDKITLIYSVKNEFNPTSEVQNIGNGAFQNAPFANAPFANGSFPNGGYSCLWAKWPENGGLLWGVISDITEEI